MIAFTKAHAYGNDFLYVPAADLTGADLAAWARRLCDRHRGVGADGLILYTPTQRGATMRLINADGSPSELSGNGLRGLAAIVARDWRNAGRLDDREIVVETTAGSKRLMLEDVSGASYLFTAEMGQPTGLVERRLDVLGETVTATVLAVGNPQCVVLGPLPDDARFARLGPALEHHPAFPNRTNVEFAVVESPDRVRIRIWERGVGPTESSGTGSCAAAVAAASHGGASRDVEVIAPGGTQRVIWTDAGITLTGWAEILADGMFCAQL
jgi:diaminopimelate epimerase